MTAVGSFLLALGNIYARKVAVSDFAYGAIYGITNFVCLFFFGGAAFSGSFNIVRYIGPAYSNPQDIEIAPWSVDNVEWLWWTVAPAGALIGGLVGKILFAKLGDEIQNEQNQVREHAKKGNKYNGSIER